MRKLQQEFEAVSHTVVEMALEVSMYDEAKARAVLNTQARPSTTTGTATNGYESFATRNCLIYWIERASTNPR